MLVGRYNTLSILRTIIKNLCRFVKGIGGFVTDQTLKGTENDAEIEKFVVLKLIAFTTTHC